MGVLQRDNFVQCATGTSARREYDALEDARSKIDSQAVDVLPSGATRTVLPPITVAATTPSTRSPAPSCCCSSTVPKSRLDVSAVSVDVDAGISRAVFYDFARQDNHPRIGRCVVPKSLEWTSFLEVPRTRNGELTAIYTYEVGGGEGAGGDVHGLDLHCQVEPVESVSRIELDYDVVRKQMEGSWEVGPVRSTVGRVETRGRVLRRASLKKTHQSELFGPFRLSVSGSTSSLAYSHDGKVKAELFKRNRGKGDETRKGALSLSMPTVSVTHKGGQVKEVGVKQWIDGDRVDVHASLKRLDQDEVTVGVGTNRFECSVRSGVWGGCAGKSITLKTKGRLTSEVCYEGAAVKLTFGGKLDGGAKLKGKLDVSSTDVNKISCAFFIPL